ncbi:MAG: hypothetical protein K2X38_13555 [Gemmataceae bacterium]|nr:hypothetical protein [Gemmataceae bacterium]
MMRGGIWIVALAISVFGLCGAAGQEKKPSDPLVVTDAGSKETSLAKWKISLGAEPLPWAEPAKGKAAREEWLAFRDDGSTSFVNGIVTYLPIASLRKIDYDDAKKSVTVVVFGTKETTLSGTTKFKGINKLTIEGETDLSGLGKAVVKFQGGQPKGITSIGFPSPKPIEYSSIGRPASIAANDKEKSKHQAFDLKALYKIGTANQTSGSLWFKTSVKIDLDKIASLKRLETQDKKSAESEFEVVLKDGAKHSLILQDSPMIDGKAAKLVGLYGRGPIGWKLFPAHTITELTFDEKK